MTDAVILESFLVHLNLQHRKKEYEKEKKHNNTAYSTDLGIPITYANMQGGEDKDQFDICMQAFGLQQVSFSGLRCKRQKKRAAFATLSHELPFTLA
ncbi:hypothetical protein QW71_11955 [Paenibacillus sp. IHB B 3415]|nr:hypothetical protein QW71_11955 [Paenibacillus sp. IHB B 3415]